MEIVLFGIVHSIEIEMAEVQLLCGLTIVDLIVLFGCMDIFLSIFGSRFECWMSKRTWLSCKSWTFLTQPNVHQKMDQSNSSLCLNSGR